MTKRSDRRSENLQQPNGRFRCRLTIEDRACGFHQGQSTRMLTNRPVIVTQSDLLTSSPPPLQRWGSPYSSGFSAPNAARSAGSQASLRNRRLEGINRKPAQQSVEGRTTTLSLLHPVLRLVAQSCPNHRSVGVTIAE